MQHLLRPNTRGGSRRNIYAHYDLGNEFFAAWLDPTMTYSSALFAGGDDDLEAAQRAKYRNLAQEIAVGAGPEGAGDRQRLGRVRGHRRQGVRRQGHLDHRLARPGRVCARPRLSRGLGRAGRDPAAGLSRREGPLRPHRLDRDVRGRGRALLADLLPHAARATAARRCGRPAADHHRRPLLRGLPPQRRLHPGLHLPRRHAARPRARSTAQAARAGLTRTSEIGFGDCYARTLALWNERFQAAWPRIGELGFDERFRRIWTYYLAYCEAGFRTRSIDVVQTVLRPA